jgi:hypothetical protein
MAQATQLMFTHQEVVTALLKKENIHEGIWTLSVQFGLGAANLAPSEGSPDVNPAAIVPVLKIGIQRGEQLNSMSVDAAVVNPA